VSNWQFEEHALVAAFDVLGFKSMMNDWANIQTLSGRVSSLISLANLLAQEPSRFNIDGIQSRASIQVAQASDTFVIYCPYKSSADICQFLWNIQQILFHAIRERFPLRGAITIGSVAASPVEHLFLGPAVIEALEYERLAEWAGAIICPKLDEELRRRSLIDHLGTLLVNYKVPYKENLKSHPPEHLLCLNWLADGPNYINPEFVSTKFPLCDSLTKEGLIALQKIENTRSFMEDVLRLDRANGPENRKVVLKPLGNGMNSISFVLEDG